MAGRAKTYCNKLHDLYNISKNGGCQMKSWALLYVIIALVNLFFIAYGLGFFNGL